jgi:hypothetical protein
MTPEPVEYKPIKRNQVMDYSSYYQPQQRNPLIPENDPFKAVDRAQTRLAMGGQQVPERKNTSLGNVLMTALDVMQRPQYAVTNVLQDLTDSKRDSVGSVIRGGWQGLTGERKSSITDTFDNMGWKNDNSKKWYQGGNLARNVAGFIGDVALDPTTYISFGGTSAAKIAGKGATKEALEGVVKKSAGSIDDVTTRLAGALGTTADDIMQKASKHGAQSEIVMRIADSLGGKPVYKGLDDKVKSDVVDYMNDSDRIRSILDNGLDYVNKDILSDYTKESAKVMTELDSTLKGKKGLTGRRNQSLNSFFGEDLMKGDYNVKKILDTNFSEGQDIVKELNNAFQNPRRVTQDEKYALLDKIYAGKNSEDLAYRYYGYSTDTEFNVLETLVKHFGVDKSTPLTDVSSRIMEKMSSKKTGWRNADSLLGKLDVEGQVRGAITKIDGGVEFANGLQRVYDDIGKKFMFRYDNPFTGTVKPLADLTNVIEPVREKASAFVTNNKPIRTVVDAISHVFNPEHVSLKWKAANNTVYNAGKNIASKVTGALHRETGIPQKALEASVGLFKSMPEFLNNDKLRKAAAFYIERDNDTWAKLAWDYLSGDIDKVATVWSADMAKAYKQMVDNGVFKYLDNLKIKDPEQLAMLEKVGTQVKMFNEERFRTDIAKGIKFGDGDENAIFDTQGYLKHVYEGDPEDIALAMTNTSSIDAANMAMNTRLGSANKRKLQSLAMQKATRPDLKAVDDIVASMALREQESLRVELNKQLYHGIADSLTGANGIEKIEGLDTLFSVNEPRNNALGMRRIDIGTDESGRAMALWAVPDMVNQLNRVAQTFSTNAGAKKMLEWFDQATNAMKTLQTSANPAFTLRNFLGETMMNWFAGVDIPTHNQAAKILKEINQVQDVVQAGDGFFYKGKPMYRMIKKDFTDPVTGQVFKDIDSIEFIRKSTRDSLGDAVTWADADTIPLKATSNLTSVTKDINRDYGIKLYKIGENEFSAHDLMSMFREKGLGWSGITKGNLIRNTQSAIQSEIKGVTGNVGEQALESLKNSGDYVETWTRFSHFMDRLNKGMSVDDAVADVRAYHVDYRNLTNVERNTFRRIMPYYTYMRKNLPIQMNTLLSAFNKVGMVTHLVDSSYQTLERDNNGQPLVVDDYLKEGMALPLAVDDAGNITYLNWNLPITDLARLKYNMGDFVDANIMDMLHPFLRSSFELNANTNMRFGTQIEKYEGEMVPSIQNVEGSPQIPRYVDYMIQQLGVVNTGRQVAGQLLNRNNPDPLNPTNPAGYLGLKSVLPTRNQQNAANNQAYDYRDQLQDHIKKLKAQGKYVPDYSEDLTKRASLYNRYTP